MLRDLDILFDLAVIEAVARHSARNKRDELSACPKPHHHNAAGVGVPVARKLYISVHDAVRSAGVVYLVSCCLYIVGNFYGLLAEVAEQFVYGVFFYSVTALVFKRRIAAHNGA